MDTIRNGDGDDGGDGDDINWRTNAITDTLHQKNINPFQKLNLKKGHDVQIKASFDISCYDLYNKYGICWFRCLMQILLYIDEPGFSFVEKEDDNGLYIFLNEFKKQFEFNQNCYDCIINDENMLFHIENLYAHIIYLLNDKIKDILKDKNIKRFADAINKSYPWYFALAHSYSRMYRRVDGIQDNGICMNTCIVLRVLLNYTGLPHIVDEKIKSRFIDMSTLENKDVIQVISYTSLEIKSDEKVSLFKQLLKLFKKNKIHTEYLGLTGMNKYENTLALHIQIDDVFYQLCALTLGDIPNKLPYGHILCVVEDQSLKFPIFTGAETTHEFNISDRLNFGAGYLQTEWYDKLDFNLDIGFRECFYKKCTKDDALVYTIYEKLIKILKGPIYYQSIFDYIMQHDNNYFELDGNLVKCKSPFERFDNYVQLINMEIIDISFRDDESIQDLIKTSVISGKVVRIYESSNVHYLQFKTEHNLDQTRICKLFKIINESKQQDVRNVLDGLKAVFNYIIPSTSSTLSHISFNIKNIGKRICFNTLLIWFDKYISKIEKVEDGISTIENVTINGTQSMISKIDQFRYYVSGINFNVIDIFQLILIHGVDTKSLNITDPFMLEIINSSYFNILVSIQKTNNNIPLAKIQDFLSNVFGEPYTSIIIDDDEYVYDNDRILDQSTIRLPKDVVAYYFLQTINDILEKNGIQKGGGRKYKKLKTIFRKKRAKNSKRFL